MRHKTSPSLHLTLLIGFLLSLFVSCEKEFSNIGTDVIGSPDINIQQAKYPVKVYNKKIAPFQSNKLVKNLLGYYYDPNFGSTSVHFLAQLTPKTYSPNFGDNTVLDSVVLTIPYAATKKDDVYTIDSLYGQTPIKLSIYKNNFFLRDFDPNGDLDTAQDYFSNGSLSESEAISSNDLEGELLYYNNSFAPSNNVINLTTLNTDGEAEVTSTLSPSLRIKLNHSSLPDTFWEDLIFEKEDSDELSNVNNFYNYFRGLFFKVEPLSEGAADGSLIQLDFLSANAHLKLHYSYDVTSTTTEETTTKQGSYDLAFNGNRVNIFENNYNPSILDQIANANPQDGDAQLYLKGGEGSMAVVELFAEDDAGNNFEDYITDFKDNDGETTTIKRLINEAYLEFFVEESATAPNAEMPNRIFVFDLENNIPLADYYFDTTLDAQTSESKLTHLVPLAVNTDNNGIEQRKYKIRLTGHLNNIITKDSTNVKLGLVVSSNVGAINMKSFTPYDSEVNGIPDGSILSPKSVILHGNTTPNEAKKVTLTIFYTDSEN